MRIQQYFFAVLILTCISQTVRGNDEIPAFYKIASLSISMDQAVSNTKKALVDKGFLVLGDYSPAKRSDFHVIAFTSTALQKITLQVEDRGALASVLKVGFVKVGGRIDVSLLNPEYIFYGYLRDEMEKHNEELEEIVQEVKSALSSIGGDWIPFGGVLSSKDLKKYHYMMGMPYFDDPVKLNEFDSFESGVDKIRKNLQAGKGNTVKVFEVIFQDEQVAIFGVGLLSSDDGESRFLPIIGPEHIAAMPYEIILQGNQATILHGRFRFALHWPELTMGTFTKIMSTPGYVKDTMKALTE